MKGKRLVRIERMRGEKTLTRVLYFFYNIAAVFTAILDKNRSNMSGQIVNFF